VEDDVPLFCEKRYEKEVLAERSSALFVL
jgi:hypothetical protein